MKPLLPLGLLLAGALLLPRLAQAGTCLSADIMSPAGQKVSSPYGVDRTGRATAGYHQGIDIVNSAGRGTPIMSGSSGPARFYKFGGGGTVADVISGDTRFIYLHMDTTILGKEGGSTSVNAGDKVGTMGCAGMKNQGPNCGPHLHLYTLLKGSSLASSGYTGRTWRQGASKLSRPLTADQIKAATPATWYYVNPEPFLPRQIPIGNPYPDMEGGPGRKMTLPKTCQPGNNESTTTLPPVDPPTNPPTPPKTVKRPTSETPSAADTQSQQKSIESAAGGPSGSSDHAVKTANQPNRSLYIELARNNATELTAHTFDYDAQMDAALAQLVILYALSAHPKEHRP
ncbi:MAG: peptidoglycan DD-metalloendopeptidase family protein [Methylorubrum rhodinum]|uniref:M23 family metallopeptidase n=1 Tax=Methylorubrum rhodinum TaxID=29428 RepID=UPI003BAECF26